MTVQRYKVYLKKQINCYYFVVFSNYSIEGTSRWQFWQMAIRIIDQRFRAKKIPRENPRDTVVIINNDALQQ